MGRLRSSHIVLYNKAMKQPRFFNILFLCLFFSACVFAPKYHDGNQSIEQASQKSELIRKQIKDVDYRKNPDQVHPKKRIVVLPFLDKDPSKRAPSVLINARVAFVNALNEKEKYILLEPNQIGLDAKNYFVESESLYDLQKMATDLVKDEKTTSVSSLLEGQIIEVRLKQAADQVGLIRDLKSNYEVVVRLRLVSINNGQEIFHTVKTVSLQEDSTRIIERSREDELFAKNPALVEILIKDAFLDYANQIEDALNMVRWEGRIAAIRGEKFYLNVGQVSGVKIGDIMKVVENPSEVYDSQMGYELGKVPGKVKGTLEVISYFGQDGAVGVIHSGAGFKESDRVEFY